MRRKEQGTEGGRRGGRPMTGKERRDEGADRGQGQERSKKRELTSHSRKKEASQRARLTSLKS